MLFQNDGRSITLPTATKTLDMPRIMVASERDSAANPGLFSLPAQAGWVLDLLTT
jgi:hypothetical protein